MNESTGPIGMAQVVDRINKEESKLLGEMDENGVRLIT